MLPFDLGIPNIQRRRHSPDLRRARVTRLASRLCRMNIQVGANAASRCGASMAILHGRDARHTADLNEHLMPAPHELVCIHSAFDLYLVLSHFTRPSLTV